MTYSEQLLGKANDIVNLLVINERIRTVFVAGSVGRNIADNYSDLELFIIWNNGTTTELRNKILKSLNHKVLIEEVDEGDGEWVKSILTSNLKIDIYHWEEGFIDKLYKDVTENFSLEIYKQLSISSILDSKAIYGKEYLSNLKKRFKDYPEELAVRSIKEYAFFESWSLRYALLERNDYIALLNLMTETTLQILKFLFALNKTYLRSHNFKWLDYQINLLNIKPDNIKDRLKFITSNISQTGIEELDKLLRDSLKLVQSSKSVVDISKEIEYLNYVREPLS